MATFACVSDCLQLLSFDGDCVAPMCSSVLPTGSEDTLSALCWNHTNQVVATASSESRKIQLWQATNASLLSCVPFDKEELTDNITGVSFSSSSRYIAAGICSKVYMWDLKRRNLKAIFQHDYCVSSLLYYQDSHIFAGDAGGAVKCWDLKTRECSREGAPNNSSADCLALTSGSRTPANLVCGRSNGSLQVYDLNSFSTVRNMHIHALDGVTDIAGSPRNSKLLTAVCKGEGKVSLIDLSAGSTGLSGGSGSASENLYQPSASISLFHTRPTCVSCHENGFHIVLGCTGGQIMVYDWRNARAPVCEYQLPSAGAINDISFQNPVRPVPQATGNTPMGSHSGRSVSSDVTGSVNPSLIPLNRAAMTSANAGMQEQVSVVSDISAVTLEQEHQRRNKDVVKTSDFTSTSGQGGTNPTIGIANNSVDAELVDAVAFGTTNILPLDSLEDPQQLLSPVAKPMPINGTAESVQAPTLRQMASPTIIQIAAAPISSNNTPLPSPHAKEQTPIQHTPSQSQYLSHQDQSYASSSVAPSPVHAQAPVQTAAPVLDTVALQTYRDSVRPVNQEFLQEALDGLRYDLHVEMQEIISEQIRQFSIAREESSSMMRELMQQMQGLAAANEQLREENNDLRYAINKSKYSLQ